ncbi:MAG: response regulator transcription factor [Dissulfurimicrobium sp.]|uniref:response regulator transcription factor n=1 Tax=Dissulfurimicrobium TaxID=1769732 RepID=UPI003C717147
MKKTRVIIVDDHTLLLAGLKMLIDAQEDMEVVGEATEAHGAIQAVTELKPDCVLLDISIPGASGIEILPKLRENSPESRIIMLTMHENQQYLERAMDGGAAGFLLKKAMDEDLIYAIRSVTRGEMYISPSMLKGLVGKMAKGPSKTGATLEDKETRLWEGLSPREKEVMENVARGFTCREIAELCNLSEKTVTTYRSRAFIKLGLQSRSELVALALKLGILKKDDEM